MFLLVLLMAVYPLSEGPVMWYMLNRQQQMTHTVHKVYAPLDGLGRICSPFQSMRRFYISLWVKHFQRLLERWIPGYPLNDMQYEV